MSEFKVIELSGSSRERGFKYGSQARDLIHKNLAFYREMFDSYGVSWERAGLTSLEFVPAIESYCPECLEEMQGVAEGSGVNYRDILALNCRSEIIFALPDACTSLGILPELSAKHHTLLGQTWDWLEPARGSSVLLRIRQAGAPELLICAEAGLVGGKGLNSEGIGVCLNALSIGKGRVGVPLHILYRAILAQSIISNALDAVAHAKRAGCGNFAIGSAQGFLMNVEYTPENFDVLMPIDEPMCHTNHYLSDLFRDKDTFKADLCETFVRLNRLQRLCAEHKGPFTTEDMLGMLSDHANKPDSICSHQDPKDPIGRRFCTMYAIVMDLNERSLIITPSCPCEGGAKEYRLP